MAQPVKQSTGRRSTLELSLFPSASSVVPPHAQRQKEAPRFFLWKAVFNSYISCHYFNRYMEIIENTDAVLGAIVMKLLFIFRS